MKYQVGTRSFGTKEEVKRAVQAVLQHDERKAGLATTYPSGVPLPKEPAEFIYALLLRHTRAATKIGVGVRAIYIGPNQRHGTFCFWIERVDGSHVDFSYQHCLTPSAPTTRAASAFRDEIDEQVIAFRETLFGSGEDVPCAITGVLLRRSEGQVDHFGWTFVQLRDAFLANEQLLLTTVLVQAKQDNRPGYFFADRNLAERWKAYHGYYARLQFVSHEEHAKLTRGREA